MSIVVWREHAAEPEPPGQDQNGQRVNDIICALDNPIEPPAVRRDDLFSGYRRRIKRTYAAEKHAQDK
jgi:hypothetical protein